MTIGVVTTSASRMFGVLQGVMYNKCGSTTMDKHNQILLTTKDGRRVSIVQGDGIMGERGYTCEVWLGGEPEPVGWLTIEQLIAYVWEKTTVTTTLSPTLD